MINRLAITILLYVYFAFIVFAVDMPKAEGLPAGQCTWYAYIRAKDAGWRIRFDKPYRRHAVRWWEKVINAKQLQDPGQGTIMVLDAWANNPYGHVAYVEKVISKDKWIITHANLSLGKVIKKLSGESIYLAKCERIKKGIIIEGSDQIFILHGFLVSLKTEL